MYAMLTSAFVIVLLLSAMDAKDDQEFAKNFLIRYGYMDGSGNSESMSRAVRDFQVSYGMQATGQLDEASKNWMKVPRCAVKDKKPQGPRYRWTNYNLTYSVVNVPIKRDGMNPHEVDEIIQWALYTWAVATPLHFRRKEQKPYHLEIGFHGSRALDKVDQVFKAENISTGHAFPPGDGRVHLSNHFTWTKYYPQEKQHEMLCLWQVSTHEIGHALGLTHSNDPNSIMFPAYHQKLKYHLGPQDRRRIQALYGKYSWDTN